MRFPKVLGYFFIILMTVVDANLALSAVFHLPQSSCSEFITLNAVSGDLLYVGGIENAEKFVRAQSHPELYRISFFVGKEKKPRIGLVTKLISREGLLEIHYDDQVYMQTKDMTLGNLKISQVTLMDVKSDPQPEDFRMHRGYIEPFLKAAKDPEHYRVTVSISEGLEISEPIEKVYAVGQTLEVHYSGGKVYRQQHIPIEVKLSEVNMHPTMGDFRIHGTHGDLFLKATEDPTHFRVKFSSQGKIYCQPISKVYSVDGKLEVHFSDGKIFSQKYMLDSVDLLEVVENPKFGDFRIYGTSADLFIKAASDPEHFQISYYSYAKNGNVTGKIKKLRAVDHLIEVEMEDGAIYLEKYQVSPKLLPLNKK